MPLVNPPAHPQLASALRWPLLGAAHLAWIPSGLLVVTLFALSVALAYTVVTLAVNQVPAGMPTFVDGIVVGAAIPLGYLAFCTTFPILVAAARWVLRIRGAEGSISVTSPQMFSWYTGLLATYTVNTLAGPLLQALGLYKWFARAMGMKVGRGSMLNTHNMYDMDLIEIGKDVVLGGNAFVTGHVVEGGLLIRRKIRIGDRCVVGLNSVILPGAVLGAGSVVGAMALVPKDSRLEPGIFYAGVPAKPISQRAPEA